MAQRNISSFKTTKDSRFADNSTGQIEEVDHRNMYEDVADSFLNISDHFIDEDSFASDSATKVPSQQSVKAYVDAQLGSIGFQSASVSVSSSEILNLFSTPKQLIAAPGAGSYIQLVHAHILMQYGGTAYTNTTIEVGYATGQDIISPITNFLNVGVNTLYNASAIPNVIASLSQFENSAIQLRATGSNPTTGNGTISIKVIYRTVTI